jgi:3-phosphoshikimate 1-carboxyvinyltransferase
MVKTVRKSSISGSIVAPSSKSAMQRLIAASMLAQGESVIAFESISEDSEAVLKVAKAIGAKVSEHGTCIHIEGGFNNPSEKLSVGESGLGLRMLSPILAASPFPFEISGQGSLLKRPIGFIVESLKSSGVSVICSGDSLPIRINGPITSDGISIDGSIGSQLLTGYLMAAPLLDRDFEIKVHDLKSKPYIDLTISILKRFGIEIMNDSYQKFTIKKGQKYHPATIHCEGDWSGAAFPIVAAAVAGELTIKGLYSDSTQGDKQILDVVKHCGALVAESHEGIQISKANLLPFDFDATDVPDLFPPLVALAMNCNGKSTIRGVSRLKHKESDRGFTLEREFRKLGANIRLDGDVMMLEGCHLKGNRVSSHHDHRIAMALAIAALNCDGEVIIEDSEAVGKSWPDFFEKMKGLGAHII